MPARGGAVQSSRVVPSARRRRADGVAGPCRPRVSVMGSGGLCAPPRHLRDRAVGRGSPTRRARDGPFRASNRGTCAMLTDECSPRRACARCSVCSRPHPHRIRSGRSRGSSVSVSSGAETFACGVERLAGAHAVLIEDGGVSTRRWWQPVYREPLRATRAQHSTQRLRASLGRGGAAPGPTRRDDRVDAQWRF